MSERVRTDQHLFVLESGEADDSALHGTGVGGPHIQGEGPASSLARVDTRMTHHSVRGQRYSEHWNHCKIPLLYVCVLHKCMAIQ